MNELLKRIEELEKRISIVEAEAESIYLRYYIPKKVVQVRVCPDFEVSDPPWPDDEPFITGFDWDGTDNADKQ